MIPDLRCVYCGGLVLDRRGTEDELAVRYVVRADPARYKDSKNAHAGDFRLAWHWRCAQEDPLHLEMADADAAWGRADDADGREAAIRRQLHVALELIDRADKKFEPPTSYRLLESMGSRRGRG